LRVKKDATRRLRRYQASKQFPLIGKSVYGGEIEHEAHELIGYGGGSPRLVSFRSNHST